MNTYIGNKAIDVIHFAGVVMIFCMFLFIISLLTATRSYFKSVGKILLHNSHSPTGNLGLKVFELQSQNRDIARNQSE